MSLAAALGVGCGDRTGSPPAHGAAAADRNAREAWGAAGDTADARDATPGTAQANVPADARSSAERQTRFGYSTFFEPPPKDCAGATPVFVERAAELGLDHVQGPPNRSPFYTTMPADEAVAPSLERGLEMTGGVAVGDFDGDGLQDLYFTRINGADRLYRNQAGERFVDVTDEVGLSGSEPTNGAAWVDVDEDGDLDLLLTTVGGHRFHLYINQDGEFSEQAEERGIAFLRQSPHVAFSASFGDYDRDGYVDLHTTEWREGLATADTGAARLFHNLGAERPGHFEDVTARAGVDLQDGGALYGFASSFSDLDDDGWPDLAVAADFRTSRLFWNRGDGTFEDGTADAMVGTDDNGMGSTLGDYDGDGRIDWLVTSIWMENNPSSGNRLYRNAGDRTFVDTTDEVGVRRGYWGWAASFLDYDNDADLDLMMTNGIDLPWPETSQFRTDPDCVWQNDGHGLWEASEAAGIDDTGDGKGMAVLDFDRDGDLDIVVARHADTPLLYENETPPCARYLRIALVGTLSNRYGVGARVAVTARPGDAPQIRELRGGNNFLGQNELILHFGLGAGLSSVSEVEVRWPGVGTVWPVQVLHDVPTNQLLVITENP